MNKKSFILSIILLVTGFFVAYSYQLAEKKNAEPQGNSDELKMENDVRAKVIKEQEANSKLQKKITKTRTRIQTVENKLAQEKQVKGSLLEEVNKYRLIDGFTKVHGPGVTVTLSDAAYVPNGDNPNDYIVHQQDIQEVIYEFYAIGAEAVSINNQRITNHSYIQCVGPVVKVDGERHTAPFIIQAIGDPDTLEASLNMNGNTADLLRARGITVDIEKEDDITIDPLL